MMRIERNLEDVESEIATRLKEVATALRLVEQLQPARIDELDKCLAFARSVRENGLPEYTGVRGQASLDPVDLDREESYLYHRGYLARQLELCTCVLRTALARHVRDTGQSSAEIESELAQHREHREYERAKRIIELERAGRTADAERLRALDYVTLCADRCVLHE